MALWTATVALAFLSSVVAEDRLEVICQDDGSDDYCDCTDVSLRAGSRIVQVKCDYRNEKDILLTDRFYNVDSSRFSSAYVRISNAKSVHVTEAFMRQWQQAISSALDIWYSGNVVLSSSPPVSKPKGYRTFVGIGLIDCVLPEIPPHLIRDHHRGALRMKNCHVDTVASGFIHNINELRYLVFESSTVGTIRTGASSGPGLTLSSKEMHSWNGLLLDNVTVAAIEGGAFNVTHKSDIEEVVVRNSRLGTLGSGAFSLAGDIATNITGNTFMNIKRDAFKVQTSGQLVFSGNTILEWEAEALAELECPSSASAFLSNNTVVAPRPFPARPTLVFHESCGSPEVLVVLQERPERLSSADGGSHTTAVVLSFLTVAAVAGALVAVASYWQQRPLWHRGALRDTPLCEDQDLPDTHAAARFDGPGATVAIR